jgi:anti-anti-sigma regulatory factor
VSIPAVGTPSGSYPKPSSLPPGRIGGEDFHSGPLLPVHEAAILFAADFAAPAEAVLKAETLAPSRAGKQPWLMLCDLYEMTRNRAEFEALAPLFTARFGQPAPSWTGNAEGASDPRRAQGRERKDFFVLKPTAMGELGPEIERFLAFAESMGTVRLDLGRVSAITAAEAAALAGALQRLRRANMPMWFNNGPSLERVLRNAFNERPLQATRGYWLLLFELCILQGKQDLFEELALEYAVACEATPPAWETYVNSLAAAVQGGPAAAARDPGQGSFGGVVLRGVISSASQNQFADLASTAASGTELVIDMGKVLRIDFSAGAQFFEVVKTVQLAGKRVILANLSELNAALLEAFGFNRHAILLRRNTG